MFARQLARTTVAFNRSTQPLISKRFMAHSREEGLKEVEKWKKVSIGMTGLVILLSLKEAVSSEDHGHGPEELPTYMKIRSKPFPWSCSDCSPFDSACMKACKESK